MSAKTVSKINFTKNSGNSSQNVEESLQQTDETEHQVSAKIKTLNHF